MAGSPGHEEEDDSFGFGSELRLGVMDGMTLLSEQVVECDSSQANTALLHEPATRNIQRIKLEIRSFHGWMSQKFLLTHDGFIEIQQDSAEGCPACQWHRIDWAGFVCQRMRLNQFGGLIAILQEPLALSI